EFEPPPPLEPPPPGSPADSRPFLEIPNQGKTAPCEARIKPKNRKKRKGTNKKGLLRRRNSAEKLPRRKQGRKTRRKPPTRKELKAGRRTKIKSQNANVENDGQMKNRNLRRRIPSEE
ncbi:hypothetical protein PIB30_039308, partial [Stylosanthes scabra]|nr:hypothetical protein [Stylosanthes scabra]